MAEGPQENLVPSFKRGWVGPGTPPPPPSQGTEEEEGHRAVRGGWAPPPAVGKGPREGQRMAIGHEAPPAADENKTPWRHANPPPSQWC